MTKPESIHSPKPNQASSPVQSLAHALMPISQLCMRAGLGVGDLISALKLAFARSSAEEVLSSGRLNYSRIAALSGLTRKEVRQLLQSSDCLFASPPVSTSRQRTSRVIHGWRTDPEFLNENGEPAVLQVSGSDRSFHALVKRYGGDVTPVSVRKELERAGSLKRVDPDCLALRKASTRLKGYNNEALVEASLRLHDLASSFVMGVESPKAPVFHGFHELMLDSTDAAALFHKTFSERGASLLAGVDRWTGSQSHLRQKKTGTLHTKARVGIGIYLVNDTSKAAKARIKAREMRQGKKKVSI